MNTPKDSNSSQQKLLFPDNFLWGASTSHFQIEGNPVEINNRLSDWSQWTEDSSHINDQSNADTACDFFQRYSSDLNLLTELNLNSFRLSLNWAAILPWPTNGLAEPNVNKEMIDYYRLVLQTAKNKNIKNIRYLIPFLSAPMVWPAKVVGENEKNRS